MGLIDTLQTAAAVVLAAPIAMLGGSFLLEGRLLAGAGFLAIAIGLVAIQRYLVTPRDVPLELAANLADRVVKEPEDDDQG
ncbi:MAG: hypothetical protein ABEJ35_01910 [Halobacteriaceae archaeon]